MQQQQRSYQGRESALVHAVVSQKRTTKTTTKRKPEAVFLLRLPREMLDDIFAAINTCNIRRNFEIEKWKWRKGWRNYAVNLLSSSSCVYSAVWLAFEMRKKEYTYTKQIMASRFNGHWIRFITNPTEESDFFLASRCPLFSDYLYINVDGNRWEIQSKNSQGFTTVLAQFCVPQLNPLESGGYVRVFFNNILNEIKVEDTGRLIPGPGFTPGYTLKYEVRHGRLFVSCSHGQRTLELEYVKPALDWLWQREMGMQRRCILM